MNERRADRDEDAWWRDGSTDLGSGHWVKPLTLDGEHVGFIVSHLKPDGVTMCWGTVFFKGDPAKRPIWSLDSADPLTLTPSIRCSCGDHGFITNGKWVSA